MSLVRARETSFRDHLVQMIGSKLTLTSPRLSVSAARLRDGPELRVTSFIRNRVRDPHGVWTRCARWHPDVATLYQRDVKVSKRVDREREVNKEREREKAKKEMR